MAYIALKVVRADETKIRNLWYSKWRTQVHGNEARLILGHGNEARQPSYPFSLLEDHVVARILFSIIQNNVLYKSENTSSFRDVSREYPSFHLISFHYFKSNAWESPLQANTFGLNLYDVARNVQHLQR